MIEIRVGQTKKSYWMVLSLPQAMNENMPFSCLTAAECLILSKNRPASQHYDEQVWQALISVWDAANQICSKRLVPFLPQLVTAIERHGHPRAPVGVRARLLSISPATVDRSLAGARARKSQAEH